MYVSVIVLIILMNNASIDFISSAANVPKLWLSKVARYDKKERESEISVSCLPGTS